MLVVLCLPGTVRAADWSSLWLNADQRAERLMRDGKAAEAAQTYRDPRRRAYAQLVSGNYQAAAQGFQALADTSKSSDDRYNQGNALAHAGDLQGAIKAYDEALTLDPKNSDAAHNRKLVEAALKQQQQSPDKNQQDQGQSQNSQGGQNPGQQDQQHGDSQSNPLQSDTQQQARQANQNNPQAKPQSAGQNPQGSAQTPHDQNQGTQSPSQGLQAAEADHASEQEQARRDAQASQSSTSTDGLSGATQANLKPPSEQQLAEDQWLRRIPDDPGGLLRRKFMLEHLMRQRYQQ